MFQGTQNTCVKSEKRSDGVGGKADSRKEKKFSFFLVANDSSIQVEFLLLSFLFFLISRNEGLV